MLKAHACKHVANVEIWYVYLCFIETQDSTSRKCVPIHACPNALRGVAGTRHTYSGSHACFLCHKCYAACISKNRRKYSGHLLSVNSAGSWSSAPATSFQTNRLMCSSSSDAAACWGDAIFSNTLAQLPCRWAMFCLNDFQVSNSRYGL